MGKQQNNTLSKYQIWGRNNKRKPRPNCLICGKEVKKRVNKLCSISCSNVWKYKDAKNHPNWKGGKIKVKCEICKEVILRSPSRIKVNPHTVCSRKCQGFLAMKLVKKKDTDIEREMEKLLKKAGIKYEKQKKFFPITIADFFLPKSNTAIFCDGDYWHSLEHIMKKDKRQTRELRKTGVKVIRFKGSEIYAMKGRSSEEYFEKLYGKENN